MLEEVLAGDTWMFPDPVSPAEATSAKFAPLTPVTCSLKTTSHVTVPGAVGVGTLGDVCGGRVSIDDTVGAEGVDAIHWFSVSVSLEPSAIDWSNFDGTSVPVYGALGFSSNENP